jgi:acetyltransferase
MQAPSAPSPTYNVFHYDERKPLDAIFKPRSVAVIGATDKAGSVGRSILWNLISSPFGGTVYPVNPNRPSVLGIRAYRNMREIPEQVDLAVIVTPAAGIPALVQECADIGVKGIIIISAGFKEIGPEGVERERQIMEIAQKHNIRIVGPNCLGVMNPVTGLNATFAATIARPGKVAFISQSGALCTAVLDWSLRENVGFSAFVSIGSMLDVGWGDLIDYLGDDPNTRSIVIYMESVGDARRFMSAAREVALNKPIIIIKAGRTGAAAKAAASHTGSLTGSHEVLEAAFRRSGVLQVENIADLFYMAEVLDKQPRPIGPRMTILTNAGGPGVLATDALISRGGELATLSDETITKLNEILPSHWSHNNPVDILGDAGPDRYAQAAEILVKDPNSNGLLIVVTPQAMTDATKTAQVLQQHVRNTGKPVIASWMGGETMEEGENLLSQAGVPTFSYPDTAAKVFSYMWQYQKNLNSLYETPTIALNAANDPAHTSVTELIERIRATGRTILTEAESKQVLHSYGIPTPPSPVAATADEAVAHAEEIGYPVVVKLNSETITHKTDVGGVQLNLQDANAVRNAFALIESSVLEKHGEGHFDGVSVQPMVKLKDAYEIILGSSLDPQFGPVLLFGSGGTLVEVFKDSALALPPLNTTLARRMMENTKIYEALRGVRGRAPVDMHALEGLLVRFSQLVVEQRMIKEIDINPLLCSPEGLLALDARVVLHEPGVARESLPKLAVRPYPLRYVSQWELKDGTPVTVRPIRPEDEPLMVKFHQTLSERSVYYRWFQALKLDQRVAHERLTRICFIDYDREMALVVTHHNHETGEDEILGVGRLTIEHGSQEAEYAILVSDAHHGKGIGTELLRRLIQIGRDYKLGRIIGWILPENREMQNVARKAGFKVKHSLEDQLMFSVYDLQEQPEA